MGPAWQKPFEKLLVAANPDRRMPIWVQKGGKVANRHDRWEIGWVGKIVWLVVEVVLPGRQLPCQKVVIDFFQPSRLPS